MGEGMKNLTYIGWNEILQRYIVHEEKPTGATVSHRFKTKMEADEFIIDDWQNGGVEEFIG